MVCVSGIRSATCHFPVLRFWKFRYGGEQVDENGESFWIFESRDVSHSPNVLFCWLSALHKPSRPANPIDSRWVSHDAFLTSLSKLMSPSRLFWTALYVFPALWLGLFFVSLLKFNLSWVHHINLLDSMLICPVPQQRSFIPIVVLALIFNVTNVIGFTYACVPCI